MVVICTNHFFLFKNAYNNKFILIIAFGFKKQYTIFYVCLFIAWNGKQIKVSFIDTDHKADAAAICMRKGTLYLQFYLLNS